MARLKDRQTSPAVYEQLIDLWIGIRSGAASIATFGTTWDVSAALKEGRAATASYLAEANEEAETREVPAEKDQRSSRRLDSDRSRDTRARTYVADRVTLSTPTSFSRREEPFMWTRKQIFTTGGAVWNSPEIVLGGAPLRTEL